MNIEKLKRGIYVWINGACGYKAATVYWGEPNAPRPHSPAVRLKIINYPDPIGFAAERPAQTTVLSIVFSDVPDSGSYRFSLGGYGTEPIEFEEDAEDIQLKIREIPGCEDVLVISSIEDGLLIVMQDVENPTDLSVIDNTLEFEESPVTVVVDEDQDAAGDMFLTSQPNDFTLSVDAYGDLSAQIIQNIIRSISDRKKMMGLNASNLSALQSSPPRDLSRFIDTKWEKRTQVDIDMMGTDNFIQDLGNIRTLTFSSSNGGNNIETDVDADDA